LVLLASANLQSERATAPYADRLPSCLSAKNLQRQFPVASKELRKADAQAHQISREMPVMK